jgi:REP element-mobilizing transposase RayT
MANTYTQIYMHIVFAVGQRRALIGEQWMDELYHYLAGACQNRRHFVHAIGGTADHVHMLVGLHPSESVSDLVKSLKSQSTRWINDNYCHGIFYWQSGYGAFSYVRSLLPAVKKYIENQKEHHRHVTFQEEFADMLEKAGVQYEPEYMLKGFLAASGKETE